MTIERNLGLKLLVGILITLSLTTTDLAAQDAASFYKDKTVTLLVGFSPGGGYDSYARLLMPYLERETGATVVVKNRPGGGSLVAMNQLYAAEPDGLTIMLIPGHSATIAQMTDQEGARFDVTKFAWLGRVAREKSVILVGAKSPYRSLDDLINSDRPIRFASGRGAGHMYFILCRALNLDCTFISGYRGLNEMILGVIRGEADIISSPASTAKTLAIGDEIFPIATFGRERMALFSETPTILERDDLSAEQITWLQFEDDVRNLGRALVATPGTPDDRVAYLRRAVARAMADPEAQAAATKVGRELNYLSGEELLSLAQTILGVMNSNMRDEIRAVLLGEAN